MAGFDFPASPPVGTLVPGGNNAVYLWDGTKWIPAMQPVPPIVGGPFLPIAGGALTGPLTLYADPTVPLGAATKQYVDTNVLYTATGSTTPRHLADHLADVVHVKNFGAVFDGNSHPLSGYYATIAAAQAVYPHAVALTDEIDGVAIQAAINFVSARVSLATWTGGGTVVLPPGIGLLNQPLRINTTNVSLRGSQFGFNTRTVFPWNTLSGTTKLLWAGAARTAGQGQATMLTIAPALSPGRRLAGCSVTGIWFDCNGVQGCSGVLIASVWECVFDFGVTEPRSIPFVGSSVTAGSRIVTLPTTVGVTMGQPIVSASLPDGLYVSSITDATHLLASGQANATSTETVAIGGEATRFDTVDGLPDVNDTQNNEIRLRLQNNFGTANTSAPVLMIGASGVVGSGPTLGHFGNTSGCFFSDIIIWHQNGVGMVLNGSDHNHFRNCGVKRGGGNLSAGATSILLNGSLDPNFGSTCHVFDQVGSVGAIIVAGTNTAGFTAASTYNRINFLPAPGSINPFPVIGTGASMLVSSDTQGPSLAFPGSFWALAATLPDSTVNGGNIRGHYAVDWQNNRVAATQVASGVTSLIAGGSNNTASGDDSVILGGVSNTTSGAYAVTVGGNSNVASGFNAVATGISAVADLYCETVFCAGILASGKRAQHCQQILRANSAANVTPVRLTADQAAAGAANCVNLLQNSTYNIAVRLTAVDSTTTANSYVWTQPIGILRRQGSVATTVYAPGTPVVLTTGTTAGIAITEAADTTNGGYSLTFTPPTGNAVIWRVGAVVTWTRVDS